MNSGNVQVYDMSLVTSSVRQTSDCYSTKWDNNTSFKVKHAQTSKNIEESLEDSNSQKPKTRQNKMKSHGQSVEE